jgi:hypothetical protein
MKSSQVLRSGEIATFACSPLRRSYPAWQWRNYGIRLPTDWRCIRNCGCRQCVYASHPRHYGVLLAFAFLLPLPMFMLPMFAGMLAFALFVFVVPVLALAGGAVVFALPAVFELSAVVQPAQKTVAVSKSAKAMVRRIKVPPVCIQYQRRPNVQEDRFGGQWFRELIQDWNYIVDGFACHASSRTPFSGRIKTALSRQPEAERHWPSMFGEPTMIKRSHGARQCSVRRWAHICCFRQSFSSWLLSKYTDSYSARRIVRATTCRTQRAGRFSSGTTRCSGPSFVARGFPSRRSASNTTRSVKAWSSSGKAKTAR